MLVLSRKVGESILIGENVTIEITSIEGDRVCIGIDAPKDVRVYRKELLQQTIDINKLAAGSPPSLFFEHLQVEERETVSPAAAAGKQED